MRNPIIITSGLVMMLAGICMAGGGANERDAVPDWVAKEAKAIFPDAQDVQTWATPDSGLQTIFGASGTTGGKKFMITMGMGGDVENVNKELAVTELPDAISKAIDRKHRGAKIESVTQDSTGQGIAGYNMTILTARGKQRGVVCAPDGEICQDYLMPPEKATSKPTTAATTRPA